MAVADIPQVPFSLAKGWHRSPQQGACFNELAALLAGEPFCDTPACVSPLVRRLGTRLNDHLDNEKRQLLRPFVLRSLGTADDGREEERRQMCNRWLLGFALPLYLDAAGREEAAKQLRALPADLSVEAVGRAIRDARDEAWDARVEARKRLTDRAHAELAKRGVDADADMAADVAAAVAATVAAAAAADVVIAAAAGIAAAAAVAATPGAAADVAGYWTTRNAALQGVREKVQTKAREIAESLNAQLLPSSLDLLDRMLPPGPLVGLAVPLEQAKVICAVNE